MLTKWMRRLPCASLPGEGLRGAGARNGADRRYAAFVADDKSGSA